MDETLIIKKATIAKEMEDRESRLLAKNITELRCNEVLNTLKTYEVDDRTSIIFDIDSTLIDVYDNIVNPVYKVYIKALQKGINIFIITSRKGTEDMINYTKEQLESHGILNYKYIYFMNPKKVDVKLMKLKSRKNIYDRGYNVIYSLGDSEWDGLDCKYAGTFVKIDDI